MKCLLGIDLGGTNIKAGVLRENGEIISKISIKTQMPRPAEEIVDDIAKCALMALEQAGISLDEIPYIGMGVPGTVDQKTKTVEYANNLPFLKLPIGAMLQEKMQKTIYLDNDANVAALAELFCGAAKGVQNAVVVTLGTGVGGGIVLNGKIYTGLHYCGGELGHMGIALDGRPCTCGRNGCFESYASAVGLVKTTKEVMHDFPDSLMWPMTEAENGKVSGRTAFAAARQNDLAGQKAVDLYIKHLGYGIANIINILAPEVLAIGGGVSKEGDALLLPLREEVWPQLYQREREKQTKIVLAQLQNDAGIIGAGFLGKIERLDFLGGRP